MNYREIGKQLGIPENSVGPILPGPQEATRGRRASSKCKTTPSKGSFAPKRRIIGIGRPLRLAWRAVMPSGPAGSGALTRSSSGLEMGPFPRFESGLPGHAAVRPGRPSPASAGPA